MSEEVYLSSGDFPAGPEISTLDEESSSPGTSQIEGARESRRGRSVGEKGEGSAQSHVLNGEREILESLKKVRDRALAVRRRAIADAFVLADQCKVFAQHLPKAQLIAFIRAECRVSRSEANAYLLMADLPGPERAVLKQSAIDVSVLCRLAKEPLSVRNEAFTMLRSGRSLSLSDLRLLRRDVLAAEAAVSGRPDRSAVKELKSAVRLKAQEFIDRFLEGLGGLANAFADLYNETNPEDRSPETVARVGALAESARRLSAQLQRLVPADFLASGDEWPQHSWARVFQTLNLLADRKLCSIEDWSWPEVDPLWIDEGRHEPLLWALGQELPELSRHRRRVGKGVIALDRSPRSTKSRPSATYRYSVLELCAGAGGQAIGLHAAGFWHAGIFERDPEAAATLRANRPKWPVFEADINTIDVSRYKGVDLVAGGLPCQPYSQAGERRGAEDERDLFDRALEIIEQVQPKAVLIENVVGISQVTHGVRRLQVYAELERMGYDAEWRIIEGPDFGLAQNRRRAILVALRRGMLHRFRWPLAPEMAQTSVGSRLKDLMGARGWRRLDQWVAKANGLAPTLIGGSTKKMGIDLAQPNSRQAWFNIAVDPRKPAKEAPDPDFDGIPCLTLPMLARLQDFPDDWVFSGSRQAQFRQMANAFPPRLSRVLGLALQRALSGEEIDLGTAIEAPLFKRLDLAEFNRHMREAAE